MSGIEAPVAVPAATMAVGGAGRRSGADLFGAGACAVGVLLLLAAALAPALSPFDPTAVVTTPRAAPSWAHLMGSDQLGRDVLSRTFYGARQTLAIALASTLLAGAVGVPLGMISGYIGRWSGALVMRGMDVLLAFPGLLLALVVVTIRGPGTGTVIVAVAVSFAPVFARVIFGSTQRARGQEYIAAARVVGCGPARVLSRHVLPVVLPEVLVLLSSAVGWSALLAATLNFLGFGIRPPTAEWGADLGAGVRYISQSWWISAAPGLAITLSILVANLVGDYLGGRLLPSGTARGSRRAIPQLTATEGE